MTTQAAIPLKWYVPFAQGDGARVEIPVTTADPTRASQTLGFPPLTMQPPESGGVPPQGEDFNGGMNQVARVAWWVLNGGGWPYDASFATNGSIGGYPNGATLQAADFRGDWISLVDNNTTNPDTGAGTTWVPGFQYGVTALTGLTGGTVTTTPAQASKNSITLAGTLSSTLTVVLPAWLKNWTITNNTTGAFVTIVKTAAGSGVTIPQNAAPTRVFGDGTSIVQSPENIATAASPTQAVQLSQAPINSRVRGLRGLNNTGTPNTQYDITATFAELQSASQGIITKSGFGTLTANIAVAGPALNGRDQAGAFAANSEVHIFIVGNATQVGTITSTSTTPNLGATGLTHWCYVCTVMLDGSSNIRSIRVNGSVMEWDTGTGVNVTTNQTATTFTPYSLTTVMPAVAVRAILTFGLSVTNTTLFTFNALARPTGSAATGIGVVDGSVVVASTAVNTRNTREFIPSAARSVDMRINSAPSGGGFFIDSVGYVVPNGDN